MKRIWFVIFLALVLAGASPAPAADVSVLIREWSVPAGPFPHDPAVAPDGALWYTGMQTNTLGRLDPRAGAIRTYPLKTPQSGPRRIAVTRDDIIWYTDYRRGYLGRLNPADGRVEEWPSPGGRSAKPYGMAATPDGAVWYSESGIEPNTIVRFDPTPVPLPAGRFPREEE